jgi:ABC-type amino acid transport substrate-binding protein
MCSFTRGFLPMGRLVLAGVLLLALGGQAFAATLDEVKRRGKLVVGIKTDYPPFGYLDQSGKNIGFEVDIARHLAKALLGDESKIEFTEVPTGSRITRLHSGTVDMLLGTVTVTEVRRSLFEFSNPYFLSGSMFLVVKNGPVMGPQDLAGKRVAVIRGAIQEEDLGQLASGAKPVQFWEVSHAVEALKAGRVDAFAHDDIMILGLARPDGGLRAVGKPLLPRPYAIAARKRETAFIQWVNDQLAAMKRDGTFDQLWQKYFSAFQDSLVKP